MKRLLLCLALVWVFILAGCGPSGKHDLLVDLDKAAAALNTAARLNHSLAAQKLITVAQRRQIALIIHTANDDLIAEIDFAKTLTDASFAAGKAQIRTALGQIAAALSSTRTGIADVDALLQAAAVLINTASALVSQVDQKEFFKYKPEFDAWADKFRLEAA